MKVWLGKQTQTKLASEGLSIPTVKGTVEAIKSPFYKALACRWIIRTGFVLRWINSLGARRVVSSTTKLWPSLPVPNLRKGQRR
jgi:hypothetical protein